MEPVVWTTLGTGLAEDVITGLEFLVDLPMWSLVGQQDEKTHMSYYISRQDAYYSRSRLLFHNKSTKSRLENSYSGFQGLLSQTDKCELIEQTALTADQLT